HLGDPDLPGAAALRKGRRPLRRFRDRRRRQLLRGRLAGGAEPHPVDDLLRRPLGAERPDHPPALGAVRRGAAALFLVALAAATAAGCGGGGDGSTRAGAGLPPAGGGGGLTYTLPALPATLDPL